MTLSDLVLWTVYVAALSGRSQRKLLKHGRGGAVFKLETDLDKVRAELASRGYRL